MELPQIPPIDIDQYRWRRSQSDPDLWQRRACGTEATVGVEAGNKKGESDMFYSAAVSLSDSHKTLKDVHRSSEEAWKKLRFQHPEIACWNAHDGDFRCLLQYRAPKSDQEAQAWAEKTVIIEASERTPMEIRDASVKTRESDVARSADAVVIYIVASVPTTEDQLRSTELRFLFHSNHLYLDGIGMRGMIDAFFKGLAFELSGNASNPSGELPWQQNAQNLPPAVVEVMRADQAISGPVFDAGLKQHLGGTMQMMTSWSFETKAFENGKPTTLFYDFSEEQSQNIVGGVKKNLGKDYTITHLANAAMLLALLDIRQPPKEGDPIPFVPAAIIHGRQLMTEPYSSGKKPYYPVCQVNGNILFKDVREYVHIKDRENNEKTKELLAKGAKVVKDSYAECINRPCAMATSIPVMEMFATMAHFTPPEHLPKISVPMLASDGINDRYISHEYFSTSRQQVFTIKDVHFWLNQYSPIPFFRLSSWRDCVRLSIDFCSTYYSEKDMQGFLNGTAGYMIAFAA